MPSPPEHHTPLTPEGAFVVQVRIDPTATTPSLAGRVEHIVSGQAQRFESAVDLLTFMRKVLREQQARENSC